MPDFESGPPHEPPMVENILPGDYDFVPGARGLRYNLIDSDGNPTTQVFRRANTPKIGRNDILHLALQKMMSNENDAEQARAGSDNESGVAAADFPVPVSIDTLSMIDGGDRLDTPRTTLADALAAHPGFGQSR
ncbi:hypothetical protein EYC59_05860 [Candidatus Saccharibacteria bacterium]|nr:MAG: hypothetical protein EYC59_05860 [Candidatus Saccharibacteria bacterium]